MLTYKEVLVDKKKVFIDTQQQCLCIPLEEVNMDEYFDLEEGEKMCIGVAG